MFWMFLVFLSGFWCYWLFLGAPWRFWVYSKFLGLYPAGLWSNSPTTRLDLLSLLKRLFWQYVLHFCLRKDHRNFTCLGYCCAWLQWERNPGWSDVKRAWAVSDRDLWRRLLWSVPSLYPHTARLTLSNEAPPAPPAASPTHTSSSHTCLASIARRQLCQVFSGKEKGRRWKIIK